MAACCIHCGVEEGELHASDCPELRSAFERLERERDAARAEVERLRKSVEDWHDAAVRAERNAAMSQEETIKLIEENERLAKCCTQRGARMQIMRDFLDAPRGLGPPTEWWYFCEDHPEAHDWFDEDGVPR